MFGHVAQPKVQQHKVKDSGQPESIVAYLRGLRRELSIKDTARILARHPETVRMMILTAGLPAVKRGKSWRIDPIRLADWLDAK